MLSSPAFAQQDIEQLRDALRRAVTGLQALQGQNTQLQQQLQAQTAAAAQAQATLDAREAELARVRSEAQRTVTTLGREKEALTASLARTESGLAARGAELTRTQEELRLTQERLADTDARRRTAEEGRARESELRQAAEATNQRLYDVARDILAAYEGRGAARRVLEREPVTGLAGVALDQAVQDYQEKLLDQKLR